MRKGEGAQKSYKESYRGSSQSLSKDQTEHIRFFRAECKPDRDFTASQPDAIGNNAINSDDREQQCRGAKKHKEHGPKTRFRY